MASRDEIIAFCDELLEAAGFADYGPNGLQVPGRPEVELVVTGVSAHLELFRAAAERDAGLILVHHGILWEGQTAVVTPAMRERLRLLFDADASLAAYHLPLDAHPEVGNNALLCRALGFAPDGRSLAEAKGRRIGLVGRHEGLSPSELFAAVERCCGRPPTVFDAGPVPVRSAGFVSGAGSRFIGEAVAMGLDALITGEPSEHAMADAREGGIHFVAGGHYATERLGIRRLGELVAERFGVKHEFLEFPNPV